MKRSRYIKKLLLENKKVEIIETNEDPKLFLTYSEDFMTLTLFFEDGHYDDSQIIIGENKNAIKWAEELFSYYNKDGD
jgi:predicted transcriptional regulator